MEVLEGAGYRAELTFPHWLGKAWRYRFVDLVFSSGNGVFQSTTAGSTMPSRRQGRR